MLPAGHQRINLDDLRIVGSVGWRQNEQTFDGVRLNASALGPVTLDLTYAWSDRTIFGIESALQAISGDNIFADAGARLGAVTLKGFAYLIAQDASGRREFSSQTFVARVTTSVPIGKAARLHLIASYARQSDWRGNPNDYAADYWLGEAALQWRALTLAGGYEVPGANDNMVSFQTPLVAGHKFQGWADKFLVTPPNGIRDLYASAGYAVPALKAYRYSSPGTASKATDSPRIMGPNGMRRSASSLRSG